MASIAVSRFLLPHPATLCPPPLHLQQRTRKTTNRTRIFRKPTSHSQSYVSHGPLDDIIAEIKNDILELPPGYSTLSSSGNWSNPLKAPSTWAVTPLPVSRAPSDQPLTIRKNRNCRSSTSESSAGDSMSSSRNNSQDVNVTGTTPWPLFDASETHGSANSANTFNTTTHPDHGTTQPTLENAMYRAARPTDTAGQRRPSRLQMLRRGFPRLRRMGTGDTSVSTGDVAEPSSAIAKTTSPIGHEGFSDSQNPNDGAVDANTRRTTDNYSLETMMERMAMRLPSPADAEHGFTEGRPQQSEAMLTTLRAAIRIFPEVKILTEGMQEFSVAIEIEGVLFDRGPLPNVAIDVVFVVDNGYYVTKDCLEKAADAVNGALYHIRRSDRLALYTTHCTHNTVTGNRPELQYPLQPLSTNSEEVFLDLTTDICRRGTQAWEPARPNPPMADVICSVARSLQGQEPRSTRTHIVLLSPAACILHGISKTFPDLFVHQVNPATLPYCRQGVPRDARCFESCCRNVSASGVTSYQAVPRHIKRIFKNARSMEPVGELSNISIDIRAREGCKVIDIVGSKDVPHLRLGQSHTVFVRIRVDQSKTQEVDLNSVNPIFKSSLEVKGLRQELQNAVILGAIKVHLLDMQLYHQNSIHPIDCWNYTEAPFIVTRELGRLALPINNVLELYKRQYFHKFIYSTLEEAKVEADRLLASLDTNHEAARKFIERVYQELDCHTKIRQYEQDYRQKLPLCPGPIDLETPHERYLDMWNKRRDRHHGMGAARGGISSFGQ